MPSTIQPPRTRRPRRPQLARLLVPTDLSPPAALALRYAVPMARQVGGRITLLHVLDWPVVPAAWGALTTDEARLTQSATAALETLAQATVPPELRGPSLIRRGRSYQEIAAAAQELRTDLIVLATQGRTGVPRALLGSTAERVVRHAPCPVLTVRGRPSPRTPSRQSASLAPRINRILVPVDFSPPSRAAVRYATGLARVMQARLGLLHVLEPLPVTFTGYRDELAQIKAATQKEATERLAALAARVPRDIPTEPLLCHDAPRAGIIATARRWRSDLIVLSTRGLTGLQYIVLGSTAEAVVRHAPCPVLTLGQS